MQVPFEPSPLRDVALVILERGVKFDRLGEDTLLVPSSSTHGRVFPLLVTEVGKKDVELSVQFAAEHFPLSSRKDFVQVVGHLLEEKKEGLRFSSEGRKHRFVLKMLAQADEIDQWAAFFIDICDKIAELLFEIKSSDWDSDYDVVSLCLQEYTSRN